MNKNCIIISIECQGKFVSYDTQGGNFYTEEEAAARIDELNRENPDTWYQVVTLAP